MRIIVENEQEAALIQSLCDVALKSGGLGNMNAVQNILTSVEKENGDRKPALETGEKKQGTKKKAEGKERRDKKTKKQA